MSFLRSISQSVGRAVGPVAASSALAVVLMASSAQAQQEIPAFNVYGQTDSSLMIDPGIAAENINDVNDSVWTHRSFFAAGFPRDTVRHLSQAQAKAWLARLPKGADKGIQAEPMAQLLVAAGEDSAAVKVLAKRLATPGLTATERAFTLYTGVLAFADALQPQRFPLAERYMKELNDMGAKFAQRRYEAEIAMVNAYDDAGRTDEVAKHGIVAIHLAPLMPMKDLEKLHWAMEDSPYMAIASAVAIQSDGQAKIKEMNDILTATTKPASDSVAMDSSFFFRAKWQGDNNVILLDAVSRLGTAPGPILSNRWLNTSDSTRHDMVVNDGVIRVIETTHQGCPGCVIAARRLQTIADNDSAIHPILVTWTTSAWANRVVSPDSNAKYMTDFWVDHIGIKYPIALWIAYGRDTLSDGSVVENLRDDSGAVRYPESGFPQFYVIDGKGRIRASFLTSGLVTEREIVETVHRLIAEQKQEQHAALPMDRARSVVAGE